MYLHPNLLIPGIDASYSRGNGEQSSMSGSYYFMTLGTVPAVCRNCGKEFKARKSDILKTKNGGTSCSKACYNATRFLSREPVDARLWPKINKSTPDACWPYKERVNEHGYGVFHIGLKSVLAHRISYELTKGTIPPGMVVMHTCDNPPCCNPNHLVLGTQNENIADMHFKKRHRYVTGENHYRAQLTWEQVRNIRKEYHDDFANSEYLAQKYNVKINNLMFILNNKTWKE